MADNVISRLQASLDEPGFCAFLGIKAQRWETDTQTLFLSMPMKPDLEGGAGPGHAHGGAIGAFVDTAATFALFAAGVENCPTVNYRLDLMRPIVSSDMAAKATIRRRGRTLAIVDVEVTDKHQKLAALCRATFAILDDAQ